MELDNPIKQKKSPKKSKGNSTPIRILRPTAKALKSLLQKLNKKPLGRKVRADDLILKALSLLEEKHFEQIKKLTLSNADRLELFYREYCKAHGHITKDDYLGVLLHG